MEGGSESSKNEMMCWRSSMGRSVRKAIPPISSLDIKMVSSCSHVEERVKRA